MNSFLDDGLERQTAFVEGGMRDMKNTMLSLNTKDNPHRAFERRQCGDDLLCAPDT